MVEQSSLSELKDALEDTLEARGVLGSIKARIRSEIFQAIEDKSVPKAKLSNENLLINDLIREYLAYNNYRHTLSVFIPETGQPAEPAFDRAFLSKEINVEENPLYPQIPLLYSLLSRRKPSTETTIQIGSTHPPPKEVSCFTANVDNPPAPLSFSN